MAQPASLIMVQFLEWVSLRSRTYAETMDAWRTSCPRLSVWEDALADCLIEAGGEVKLTPRGQAALDGRAAKR